MKKKIFALILMTALMSIFVACGTNTEEDEKPIALSERVGTYKWTQDANNYMTIKLEANSDGTGKMTMTMTTNGQAGQANVIDIPKADMDSTESSFTEGGTTIAFTSATDKNSNFTTTVQGVTLTFVKQ